MARPRAADHDKQREAIRRKAVGAFASLGYASASMADLANACAVSKATLYHYFESKESILFEALDGYTRSLCRLAERHAPQPGLDAAGHRERLKVLIRELMLEYGRTHDYHVSLLHDVKFLGEAQRGQIRSQERRVVRLVSRLIDASFPGRIARDRLSVTTMALLGMLNFTFAWLRADGGLSHTDYAELVIDLWWQGLASPARALPDPR